MTARRVSADLGSPSLRSVVDAFGVTVGVNVSGDRAQEVVDLLARLWESCPAAPGAVPEVTVDAVFDSDPQVCTAADNAGSVSRVDLDDLLQVLTQGITSAAIDARAGQYLMLHAAALADPATGAAVAFVAPGGTGKTTLVSTLGPGLWYITDETTVVLDDLTVVPYPKPLSVRRQPNSLYKDETTPSSLGLAVPTSRVHLAALCVLERDDSHAGRPTIDTMSTLDALVALLPQTSHLTQMTRPLQRLAALGESLGGVHRVVYGESADLAGLLDELAGAR